MMEIPKPNPAAIVAPKPKPANRTVPGEHGDPVQVKDVQVKLVQISVRDMDILQERVTQMVVMIYLMVLD